MIKKYSLVFIAFLCFIFAGFGQTTLFNESIGTCCGTTNTSIAGTTFDNATLTFTGTADTRTSTNSTGYTGASSGRNVFFTGVVGRFFEISGIDTSGYSSLTLSLGHHKSTTAGNNELAIEVSSDGTTYIPLSYTRATGSGTANWILISPSGTIPSTANLRIRFTQTSTSTQFRIDDVRLTGIACTDEVNWGNIQWPNSSPQTINDGDILNIYAQVYEPGITEPVGQGTNIDAWIGYSTNNSDPSNPEWTWISASYNAAAECCAGDNDEYFAEIGSGLAPGTYYYASRFQLNGCGYVYGGTGGIWSNNSVELIVNPVQVNFCNVDYPKNATITMGNSHTVYAQVYEPGVTDAVGEGTSIDAWIGYTTVGINHPPDSASGWTWISASYGTDESNDMGNPIANDQYVATFGSTLPSGTYYYASRFQLNGSSYSYGGIQSDNVGNFWDATNNNGVLTVADPPLAEVVITEIMYNTPGTDDEWIEICNVSGSLQYLSNYTIRVNNSIQFTFPADTTIADESCITVSLGSNADGTYNNGNGIGTIGYCPFVPDYGIGASSGPTNILQNTAGPHSIQLFSANGTSIADEVNYGSGNGANGNGASLHIIDLTLNNSSASSNWQEVDYGGSSGVNSLIPNCLPAGVEINVEGNLGNYPDIADGNTNTPSYLDNTRFAAQYVGASQAKTFRIQNLLNDDLTVSNVTISGADPGEFGVTSTIVNPVIYGSPLILEITFAPTTPGVKNAIVSITNNDADENPYTFNIQGEGKCLGTIDSISPASGPEGTIVTISSSGGIDLSTASATFNGVPVTILNYLSATDELELTVPNGAANGNLVVFDTNCTAITPFTVIDSQIGGCEGGAYLTEIFISEVTDATYGGLSYIELYNPTNGDIDLTNYSIDIYINGNTNSSNSNLYKTQPLSGTIFSNQTFVISVGYDGTTFNCTGQTGGNASLSDFNSTTVGGINKKTNEHDYIALLHSGSLIDEFGVFGDNDWMESLYVPVTGDRGFNFRRLTSSASFTAPFLDTDWNIIDWAGTGSGSCSTNIYDNIGVYDFSTSSPPNVNPSLNLIYSCEAATITVSATQGVVGGLGLAYQWYYSAPGDIGWTAITDGAIYNNSTTATLDILNTIGLDDTQYYCQVREDGITCFQASNAIRLKPTTVTWDGTHWNWSDSTAQDTMPDSSNLVILNDNYNTGAGGIQTSFEACNLIVNANVELRISDVDNGSATNTYVRVQNNVINAGEIYVDSKASLVQVDDMGTFTLSGANAKNTLSKFTHPLEFWYDYTYWSSPLENAQIENALFQSKASRRFKYEASMFNDDLAEIDNSNSFSSGQDDIDDDNNDWVNQQTGNMISGVGYAATHNNDVPFTSNTSYQYIFEGTLIDGGAFNTGNVSAPIYINPNVVYNNWNLIGNPYPSAISAQRFFEDTQTFLEGVIYLWSQETNANSNTSGNQNQNFSQDDYAMINYAGGVASSESSPNGSAIPNGYVASGQGFFVIGKKSAVGSPGYINPIVFNNRMRDIGNNNQFFRTSELNPVNKLWLNLTSDNGVFNQILIGYINGASDDYDGMHYDAPRNLSTGSASVLYMTIPNTTKKYAIQAKNPESLSLNEVIPLGFYTSITVPTTYKFSIEQLEGPFLTENTVYIKDNLLNITHNLTAGDYSFTTATGTFENRFEIVFQDEALSIGDNEISPNDLTIFEFPNGQVKFTVGNQLQIKAVEIIDMIGRSIYQLKGSESSETYDLSNLSQAAYIAKVTLSNGQVVVKRAVKRF